MAQEIGFFEQNINQLPAHLAGFNSGISTDLMLGAAGRNRLGLKGGRFRLIVNGQEEAVLEQNSLEVVIVGAAKGVGRLFFEGSYIEGEKTHPSCYSADGITPGADVTNPQSVKCANCPQNQKGSKITADGTKTKACTYFKRLAIVPVMDPQHRVFQLDGKAMTIFGEGEPARNLFTLNEYAKKLTTRGIDVAHMVTKLSFDVQSSVPKLYFTPLRLIDEEEAPWVQDLINSEEVQLVTTITAITDASDSASETEGAVQTKKQPPVENAKAQPKPVTQPAQKTAAAQPKATPTLVKAKVAAPTPQVKEVAASDTDLDNFLKQLDAEAGA